MAILYLLKQHYGLSEASRIHAKSDHTEPPQHKIQNYGSLKGKVTDFKLLYPTLHTHLHIVYLWSSL